MLGVHFDVGAEAGMEQSVFGILERERGTRLDPVALDALHAVRADRAAEHARERAHAQV